MSNLYRIYRNAMPKRCLMLPRTGGTEVIPPSGWFELHPVELEEEVLAGLMKVMLEQGMVIFEGVGGPATVH